MGNPYLTHSVWPDPKNNGIVTKEYAKLGEFLD